MNIGFVVDSISRRSGGLFFSVRSLSGTMHHLLNGQVSVYSLEDSESANDLSAWSIVKPQIFPAFGPRAVGWAPELAKVLMSGPHDLLHTQGIWQGVSLAVHRWHVATGKPYLISPRGMFDPWALSQSRWKKRIVSVLYESAHLRNAACIHALCQSEADSIRAYGLKNPVCIIPNGVDLPKETEDRCAPRQKTEDQRKILLFLGRLHPKKGLVNALKAWKEALHSTSNIQHSTFDEWQFVIAGWDQGGHETELKHLCNELGLAWADGRAGFTHPADLSPSARGEEEPAFGGPALRDGVGRMRKSDPTVLFTGPAFGDAKDALLRQAHAFILPSFSEGLPMSVLEAMAYRLPVLMTEHCNIPQGFAANAAIRIGTEVGDQRSEVGDQKSGLGGQPMSITEGMRILLEMTDIERDIMGQRGRSLVEREFTWPQVAAQMKEVYEWVLGGGPRPNCVRE